LYRVVEAFADHVARRGNCRRDGSFGRSMTDESHARYFAERETTERTMSERTKNWRVAAIHCELAERYEALAKVFGAKR
jgi:hypothetical protein